MNFKTSLLSLAFLACATAHATEGQTGAFNNAGTATVYVQPELSIQLLSAPSWGRVSRPNQGSANYQLDYLSGHVSSDNGFAFDDGQAGTYILTGMAEAPVSYSVDFSPFTSGGSGSGVSLIEGYINGPSNSGFGYLDEEGGMYLRVGGWINVASDAQLGLHTSTVTILANYE